MFLFSIASGGEADHPPPPSAEAKNGGAVPPLPNMPSWRDAKLNTMLILW
jgi:hypothetical protein